MLLDQGIFYSLYLNLILYFTFLKEFYSEGVESDALNISNMANFYFIHDCGMQWHVSAVSRGDYGELWQTFVK